MKKIRILALVSAIAVMVSLYFYLSNQNKMVTENSIKKVEIVVMKTDVEENTVITNEMVEIVSVPEDSVHVDTALNLEEVIGSMNVVKLYYNEPLLKSKLISPNDDNSTLGLAYVLPKGLRGMSIDVEYSTGLSSMLKVGNQVDIIYNGNVSYNVNIAGESVALSQPVSSLLLQNIKITGLDSFLNDEGVNSSNSNNSYQTVTLELSPQDTLKLAYGLQNGTVYLALRPQGDNEWVDTTNIVLDDIIQKAKIIESIRSYYEN